MAAPLAQTPFERGMAAGELAIALSQAQHDLAGLGLAVSTVERAMRDGARPVRGGPSPDVLAYALRELAYRLDAAAAAASATPDQRAA